MLVKKLPDRVHDRCPIEAVAGAADDMELYVNAGLLQRVAEDFALGKRHHRVAVSVHDQERWVVLADAGDGTGLDRLLFQIAWRAAEQPALERIRAAAMIGAGERLCCGLFVDPKRFVPGARVDLRQIRGTEPVADRLHAARHVELA